MKHAGMNWPGSIIARAVGDLRTTWRENVTIFVRQVLELLQHMTVRCPLTAPVFARCAPAATPYVRHVCYTIWSPGVSEIADRSVLLKPRPEFSDITL